MGRQASGAKYVTSVCTGAFVLGAAGLLKGRRATTHWAYTDLLPLVGATHEPARVVKDGNIITAGGVTSGIDFGLTVVAELAGETTAQTIQLSIEYDPAPPFDAGHPDRAPDAAREALVGRYEKSRQAYRTSLDRLNAHECVVMRCDSESIRSVNSHRRSAHRHGFDPCVWSCGRTVTSATWIFHRRPLQTVICYECTFCADCVEHKLHNVCPNSVGFTPRPICLLKNGGPAYRRRSGRQQPSICV